MPVPIFLQGRPTIFSLAEQYWDLKAYPTQYVFSLLAQISQDKLEREKCMELASPEGQEEWLKYSRRPKRTILEVLHDFHKTTSSLTIEVLFELFSSIKPRCFSIASSTLPTGGLTLDILVAVVMYYTGLKKPRIGLCSNWLKDLPLGVKVYGWIKKGSLSFPRDASIPNILVGPGTGLAPFRSMLQERDALHTATRHTVHLFFGCRHKEMDFHCREELEKMEQDGKLSLYCAFSRDQEEKVYVQHRMAEHRQMLWNLIQDENAHIFISGTSKNMPDDVREVFVEDVLGKIGGISLEEAKETVKRMEIEGKFQIETWS